MKNAHKKIHAKHSGPLFTTAGLSARLIFATQDVTYRYKDYGAGYFKSSTVTSQNRLRLGFCVELTTLQCARTRRGKSLFQKQIKSSMI